MNLSANAEQIFKSILNLKSMTVIEYRADEAMQTAMSDDERKALKKIAGSNDLDEAWAIAHEQLGQLEQAKTLRDWIAKKTGSI